MKHLTCLTALIAAGSFALPTNSSAQSLFSDNFDSGTSGTSWTPRLSHADAFADFAFDYGSLGIPSAPNSGGTTVGMRFLANQSAGVQQGVSASPNGQSFTGDFRIRFDMWLNFNGPLGTIGTTAAGGLGSTQVGSFGWGTSGTSAQWAGASSSVMFGGTGDGGSTFDYRVYQNNALLAPSTGVYAAGTSTSPDARNNTNAYYASLGGNSAPSAQLTTYPQQTGVTDPGALGFKWRDVVVEKNGSTLTWKVDDLLIATTDITGATLGGSNIFFGHFDINNGSSADTNDFLITSIFDNIRVEAVPEPSTFALGVLGALVGIFALRRRK